MLNVFFLRAGPIFDGFLPIKQFCSKRSLEREGSKVAQEFQARGLAEDYDSAGGKVAKLQDALRKHEAGRLEGQVDAGLRSRGVGPPEGSSLAAKKALLQATIEEQLAGQPEAIACAWGEFSVGRTRYFKPMYHGIDELDELCALG